MTFTFKNIHTGEKASVEVVDNDSLAFAYINAIVIAKLKLKGQVVLCK